VAAATQRARNPLRGEQAIALHALSCALGCNIRWLMRARLALARKALSCLL